MRGSYGQYGGYGTYGSPAQAIVPIRVPADSHGNGQQQEIVLYDPRMNQGGGGPSGLDLGELWRTIRKHKWVVIVLMFVLMSTTLAGTMLMRPVYRSSTMIEVNPNRSGSTIKFQNVDRSSVSVREYVSTQANIIKSESVAEAVLESLELDKNPEFTGEITQRGLLTGIRRLVSSAKEAVANRDRVAAAPVEESESDRLDKMLDRFSNRLGVRNVPESTLFEISFDSFSPKVASQVANSIAQEYIRLSDERRFSSTETSKEYLEGEIQRIEAKLETSEKELTEFARKNNIVDVEERGNIMTARLEELGRRFTEVQGLRIGAESAYEQAREGRADSLPAVVDLSLIEKLRERLAGVDAEHARLSGIFKEDYPELRQLTAQRDKLEIDIQNEIGRIVLSLESRYQELTKRESKIAVQLEKQRQEMLDLKDRSIQYNILKREWETNRELHGGLLKRMKEVGVAVGADVSAISIIDRARTPSRSYKPRLAFNVVVAGILGLILGIGLALLLAYIDNTISTPDELERIAQMSSLGAIPVISESRLTSGATPDILCHEERNHEASEAFRAVRTSLMFSTPGGAPRTIVVTSSQSGEGKSFTSANLATVLSQGDARVLLVDADLRRPRIHRIFGVPVSPGLTEELVGVDEPTILQTAIPNLDLLPAGMLPPNPAELIASPQMEQLIADQSEEYDFVVIDAPPVLAIADPVILATKADGLVFVVSANTVTKDAVREAVKRLRMVQAPVLGAILNRVNVKDGSYGAYASEYRNLESNLDTMEPDPYEEAQLYNDTDSTQQRA